MKEHLQETLSTCTLFEGLQTQEIAEIIRDLSYTLKEFRRGEVYAVTGTPCRYADIVVEGVFTTRMSSVSGRQMEVDRLTAGALIAPAFIFAHDHRLPVTVEAAEDTVVFRMQPSVLSQLMERDERIRLNFIQTLSDIDVFLTRKMRLVTLLTAREKVVFFLRERARNEHSLELQLVRTRTELAEYFGIQKFTLIRVLNELTEEGIIAIDGRHVTILDPERLR